ncbi:DUF2723 domain-containing protein [candidate division GN15 bacterium]|nr:DUF2723 domain-containing protein [candidate division GN15 bacterium]
MTLRLPAGFDRTNAVVAAAVWLCIVVVYSLTKAPTLSFWDCGEFIAASYILGIPHPPGTPAYILLARIFSIIPFEADIAARVNFLSSFCSSIAALFAYLVAVRLLRHWFTESSPVNRILIYGGAACGTLFLAFGRTQWVNSVEAEVYGMSMMIFMLIFWLTLRFFEQRGTNNADRLALAIVYLAFLGIGAHMTTFLVFPVAAVVLMLKANVPRHVWFVVAAFFIAELFLIFALSSRPGEIPYYVPVIIVAIFYVFYALSFERVPRPLLYMGGGLLLAGLPVLEAFRPQVPSAFTVIGIVSLVATVGYALWILFGARFASRDSAGSDGGEDASEGSVFTDRNCRIGAFFVIAAGIMTLIVVSGLRGYQAFLLLSVILTGGLVAVLWRHIRWPMAIALLGVSLVIIGLREYAIGSLIALVLIPLLGRKLAWKSWRTAVWLVLIAAIGFSVHVFIPIRSSLHPYINENNPSRSIEATVNFIERKQYGSQGMVERMFERRAEWENQFGTHARMGFWGFFNEQYGLHGVRFLVLFVLGAFGLWEACRRRPEMGTVLLILILLTTIGLVLYMNFADGTRRDPVTGGDYLEVRDRDYFFTAGFMLFGLAIGLGVTGLIQYIRDMVRKFSPPMRGVVTVSSLVLLLLPGYALASNYHVCDRTDNYVPYDYAHNLLISADENAVLFTSGDNDTFPLWCLQEVYGVRKDVRNVNLSLANTDWYIRQIRDYMGLRLSWTDDQIDSLRPFRVQDGRTFRIQDQVVDEIVRHNFGRVPINFSATCGPGSRKLLGRSIDSMLEMSGMMYRLSRDGSGMRVEVERSVDLIMEPGGYQFRHWDDPDVYFDETTARLVRNTAGFAMLAVEALEMQGRTDEAQVVTEYLAEKIPTANKPAERLAIMYAQQGDADKLEQLMVTHGHIDSLGMTVYLSRAYRNSGRHAESEALLLDLLDRHPSYRPALDEVMTQYITARDVEGMQRVLTSWVDQNPDDQEVRAALQQLIRQMEAAKSPVDTSDTSIERVPAETGTQGTDAGGQ